MGTTREPEAMTMTAETDDRPAYEVLMRQLIMARNAPAVRRLAEEEGLSRDELAALLRDELERQREHGGEDRLGPRYDIATGEYVALEDWVERVIRGR